MTAILDVAPVVMTTADGESRPAKMWGRDSYSCEFCDSPVFGPLDWEQHERDNARYYEQRSETYTWEPYSYRAKYWEARECANPMCVSALTGDHLAQYRQREREQRERDEREARKQAEHEAAVARNAARVARRDQIHADVRPAALELGFAWCCTHEEQVPSYRDDVPMCEASGWDRGEYETHMRGHGRRAIHGTKIIKLRRKAPAATMPKLEIDPLAEITWTESEAHSQPMTGIPANKVDRRGQFWALGGDAHSAWVLPYEAAPWETGRPALVLVYAGSAGKFFTESYSAKWDRR